MYESKKIESAFVEIIRPRKSNTIVGCNYRHHTLTTKELTNTHLGKLLEQLSFENKPTLLMGDFNTDLLDYGKDNEITEFLDSMLSNFFLPQVLQPTRVTKNTKTIIDNIYLSNSFGTTTSGNILTQIADHYPQFLIIEDQTINVNSKSNTYTKRNFQNFDENNFLREIGNIEWDQVLDLKKENPNMSLETLLQIVSKKLDKYAPIKSLSKKEIKQKLKPWITTDIIKQMKNRDKILKKLNKQTNQNIKDALFDSYKLIRNNIVTATRKSKQDHYNQFFSEYKTNLKKTWEGIRSIINIKSNSKNTVSAIIEDGKCLNDPKDIANSFNKFFSTVAAKIEKKIIPSTKKFDEYLTQKNQNSLFLSPTTPDEIKKLILKSDCSKAVGPNSIPTKVLHLIMEEISISLSKIVNLTFATGLFPDCLKMQEITPIHKKDSKLQCNNYRPISLLSNISKVFEKLIYSRLYNFLTKHECLHDLQFGFRETHSTTHTLIKITDTIREALDNGKFACGVFIDLQKAFDTVNHDILLNKLEYHGIRGDVNNLFRTYLTLLSQGFLGLPEPRGYTLFPSLYNF